MKENNNFKLKSICHSCVSENPAENKALYTAGSSGRANACPRMTGESGRSMVEMLGVLAVIGVLSVAGIAGYTNAMNKHRANELLNEASKRAAIVAMQITSGKAGTGLSVAEFTNPSGYKFGVDTSYAAGGKTFSLTLSKDPSGNIDNAICNQMIAATGTNSVMQVAPGCGTITFNADMSKGGGSSGGSATCTETPTGCQECVSGEIVDSDAKCGTAQVCVDGTCTADLTGSGCAKNSDCDEGEFCNFSGNVNCSTGPTRKNGTCTSVEDFTKSDNLAGFVWGDYTDWFSAKNFCATLPGNHRMAALSDFNCPYTLAEYKETDNDYPFGYCCAEEGSTIQTECPSDGWNAKLAEMSETVQDNFWIKDLTNNSCSAFYVGTSSSFVYDDDRHYNGAYALCK